MVAQKTEKHTENIIKKTAVSDKGGLFT